MPSCPNCSAPVKLNASSCGVCSALFDGENAWKPVADAPATASTERSEAARTQLARVLMSALLLLGALEALMYALVFAALSMPFGLRNSPGAASIALAVAYALLAMLAIGVCWRRSPFHPFSVVVALPSALLLTYQVGFGLVSRVL
jgi:hypothetical protein